jgi:ABC-type molybdate transport system substrate-binding protein
MSGASGVTVFCDPTLAPALRGAGRGAGYEVAVLCAPAPLLIQQIIRHTHNDVLVTLGTAMDQAVAANLVLPATRMDGFSTSLVLAFHGAFNGILAGARFAVTDPTTASGLDGRAILAANGLSPARVQGVATTQDAAFLLTTGAVDIALLYLTDVMADPRLGVLQVLKAPVAVQTYAAAVNAHAYSPNAGAFIALLRQSAQALAAQGLVSA